MRSVNENEGVILIYLNTLNVADMDIVLHAVAPISDKIGFEKHVLFGLYRVFEVSGVIETYFFIPLFFSYPVFAFEGVDTAHVSGKIGGGYVQGGVGISLCYVGGKSYAEWRIGYVV